MSKLWLSFAITVHDEATELKELLRQLNEEPGLPPHEVVVQCDRPTAEVQECIRQYHGVARAPHLVAVRTFEGDFAGMKNALTGLCHGEWVLQLDADELPPMELIKMLPGVVARNKDVELFWLPRINVVNGLTADDVERWGWSTSIEPGVDMPVVNWPDYQGRFFRNDPERIKWVGKVHERIHGAVGHGYIPAKPAWAILHLKSIERQRAQNELYGRMG